MDLDRVYGGVPRFRQEEQWSKRLALRLLRRVPALRETVVFGRVPAVEAARGNAEVVFVCADPEALVPEVSQRRLVAAVRDGDFDIVVPVFNESDDPGLRAAPGIGYLTPSGLLEIAEMAAASGAGPSRIDRADSPVFAIRRSILGRQAAEMPLSAIVRSSQNARIAVDRGAYVHRYGDLSASERPDLVERVPGGARSVLDVGCARGAPARLLRQRGVVEIVGIEPDAEDARAAGSRYDRIVCSRLDAVADEGWAGRFDAILFGDVLEHLEDPGLALEQVRPWLSARGRVVASVPNIGNAAVLADLLEGRFDYIPYSILSGTHVRFFTRRSLADLFESCGFVPEEISAIEAPPTPRVRVWQDRFSALSGGLQDLAATEFLIVARAAVGE
ncbi:MAG: class I SAM-dependent methyltransferase [Thermoanaerobaculia bacterium]